MPEVTVLLFSVLKEKVGEGSVDVSLSPSSTVEDLLIQLGRQYPAIAAFQGVLRVAVNCEYADLSSTLRDGDEVALITPVSGG